MSVVDLQKQILSIQGELRSIKYIVGALLALSHKDSATPHENLEKQLSLIDGHIKDVLNKATQARPDLSFQEVADLQNRGSCEALEEIQRLAFGMLGARSVDRS